MNGSRIPIVLTNGSVDNKREPDNGGPRPSSADKGQGGHNPSRPSVLVRLILVIVSLAVVVLVISTVALLTADAPLQNKPPGAPTGSRGPKADKEDAAAMIDKSELMDQHLRSLEGIGESPLPEQLMLPQDLPLPLGTQVLSAKETTGPDGEASALILARTPGKLDDVIQWFQHQARISGWTSRLLPSTGDPNSKSLLLQRKGRRRIVTVRQPESGSGSLLGISIFE